MRKPARAEYVGCHRIAARLPTIAPAASAPSAMPSQCGPHPEPLDPQGQAERDDRRHEDVERGQPDHEDARGLVAPQVATGRR